MLISLADPEVRTPMKVNAMHLLIFGASTGHKFGNRVSNRSILSTKTPLFLSWFFHVLIGPSRYSHESPIFDKLKRQRRYVEVLFILGLSNTKQ